MKQILATLLTSLCLVNIFSCGSQAQTKIGSAKIIAPAGWREVDRNDERITLSGSGDRQHATISTMKFDSNPTFTDFKLICADRLKAEKAEAPDVVIQADEPFQDRQTFGMFFSGKEDKAGRLFSGYVTLKNVELITIYVESIGVDSKEHFQSFQTFVKGLKR